MNSHLHRTVLLCFLLAFVSSVQAATFMVVNSNDSGSGSLRAAISSANANGSGLDNIYFNIPGAAVVHTITLSSQLPIITSTVNIDGTSQPGYAGLPLIEINGNSSAADGLSFSGSGNNTIKAVVINSCSSNGIYISGGSGSNTIQGCFIGTDATGTVPAINGANGISIVNNGNNQIGGTGANDGNIVSCNLGNGISLLGSSCSSNTVEGNYLGTNPSGIALGNSLNGLRVINGSNNVIGGVASVNSNVIAFNGGNGVLIYATSGTPINNTIIFNSIHQNSGAGIDLGNDGITPNDLNDPDAGANDLQNWPRIDLVTDDGTDTQISGRLNSTSLHNFRIDIYVSDVTLSDLFYGEGFAHLVSTSLSTDINGDGTFSVTLNGVLLDGRDRLSATATRMIAGSPKGTSEFGLNWVFDESDCSDGIDNDGDGLIDCEDPDCSLAGQSYNWYFGQNAALSFENAGDPVQISPSSLDVSEGSGVMSDENGDLLFYTGGSTLYNADQVAMPNGTGLIGHTSATQSGVIVKDPGNSDRYYVFTNKDSGTEVRYSIVDMTLDSGRGDVVAGLKNIYVRSGNAEKLAAWPHSNGTDVWVVVADHNNLYSYQVTATGLQPVVTSSAPSAGRVYGYIKFSPDGTRLASGDYQASDSGSQISLYDFDNSTGLFSNQVTWSSSEPYGLEFSPDGRFLYTVDQGWFSPPARLNQYSLDGNTTAAEIVASEQVIFSTSSYRLNAMQLGPDHKIYVATSMGFASRNGIGVINSPNRFGSGSDFVEDQIIFTGGAASNMGLPNFPTYQLNGIPVATFVSASDTCIGVAELSVFATGAISYQWLLDGAMIPGANGSTYTPIETGDYQAVATYICGTDTSNVVSFLPDNDGDCSADIYDLDDDNDGLLDSEEQYCGPGYIPLSETFSSTSSSGSIGGLWPLNGVSCVLRFELLGSAPGVTPSWGSGITSENDWSILPDGDHVNLQPRNTDIGAGDIGRYTLDFSQAVTGLEFKIGGLDNDDALELYAFHSGSPVNVEVSDINLGTALTLTANGVISTAGSSNAPDNSVRVRTEQVVDSIIIHSGKTTGSTHQFNMNTIQIYELDYCVAVDTDSDGVADFLDLDSDGDGCFDVLEAGFTDDDGDGQLGPSPVTVDSDGLVTSGSDGYTGTNAIVTDAALQSGCADHDGDGVSDANDIDDDNDGILDADEQSCDSSSPLAAWWHNSGVTGTNLNGSYVLAISDEVIGAGLHSPDYSFTRLAVSGADEVTLDGAMLSNDYLEYVLQTLPALPTDLFLNQIGQYLHFSPGMMDYRIAVYVSDDGWVTKQLLFLNEVATEGVGATLIDVRSHYYQLKANRIYRFRVYLYDAPLVNAGNVTYDDFQIVACASSMDADNDLVLDHLDLDSDNDGIYDVIEAGGTDGDGDGVIGVGPITDTDLDGWSDISDSDNGGTALTDPDTDGDGNENRIDSDSDADGCSDTIEAGFPDSDGDGQLGGLVPPTVNASGTVTSGGI